MSYMPTILRIIKCIARLTAGVGSRPTTARPAAVAPPANFFMLLGFASAANVAFKATRNYDGKVFEHVKLSFFYFILPWHTRWPVTVILRLVIIINPPCLQPQKI